ncbi:MAG: HIT family protein [Gemmatimonadetes bacterium]|nr:HIT family protein [Gemmatimonadota bacterium]
MSCIFCDILAGRSEATFVHRDSVCAAFMDIQPVNPGHVLVVPVRHGPDLAATHPDDWKHVAAVGQRVVAALRRSDLQCEGVNLFLADGAAAGQEVFHTHLHVFPRFAGDGFGLRFADSYGDLPSREDLGTVGARIRFALKPAGRPPQGS